jgi:KipI family sensor histidine kinase inhibitor
MNVRRYGIDAVLVETGDVAPAAARARLAGERGIGDVVPGARTLLIEYDPAQWTVPALVARLSAPEQAARPTARVVEVPTRYDGADLDAVAALCGLPVDEVVDRHQRAVYTVAFCGFSPGFAYLSGLDAALQVPRLSQPRTTVPAGAVAIAGEFAAIYPRTSPGGWRLLGSTDMSLWDLDADPPALLQPGTTVRFVAT